VSVADPKYDLEAALYTLLQDDAGVTWPVYNRGAAGETFDYVVISPAGGQDEHAKLRGYDYDYQVMAISLNAAAALQQSRAVEAAIEGATLSVAGHHVAWAERDTSVDYPQILADGRRLWHIGGIYRFHVREGA
jgi:hypothetical protein